MNKGDEFQEFSTYENLPSCSLVQTFPYPERCEYVSTTPECLEKKFFINYIQLLYCGFRPTNDRDQILYVTVLLSFCLFLFVILGMTTEHIFCPALTVLSKVLGMNEHLAGVTLLAFGNGSPDLFTSFAAANDSSRLQFSDLFGAGMYVISFVGGLICLVRPFKLQANNVSRDIFFLMVALLSIEYFIMTDSYVTVGESICILSIYIIYLIIIIVDQLLLKKYIRDVEKRVQGRGKNMAENIEKLDRLRSEADIELITRKSRDSINIELTRKMSYNAVATKNNNIFLIFVQSINPFDQKEWNESGWFMKGFILFKTPLKFILITVLPTVDYELDRHGWSKLLNSLQIIIMPFTFLCILFSRNTLFSIPIAVWSLFVTVPLSIFVLLHTRTDIPPSYHSLFAIQAALGSMFVIYSCASETVQILYVLGIVTYRSNSFLGCTVLSWGNSIGDLVSNIALARTGYQKMGYAACVGGPLFNSVLGMGTTFLYRALRSEEGYTVINQGALGANCYIFLFLMLILTAIWTITTNFVARRSIGIFSVLMYGVYFTYSLLGELEIIQTYAPDTTSGSV